MSSSPYRESGPVYCSSGERWPHRYAASTKPQGWAAPELIQFAQRRPRFGYGRLGVLLTREGQHVNHKRLFRVYREEGLSVKRIRRKKLATGRCKPAGADCPERGVVLGF